MTEIQIWPQLVKTVCSNANLSEMFLPHVDTEQTLSCECDVS